MVGGKAQFYNLPQIPLVKDKPLSATLNDLDWDELDKPVYRTFTEDGRVVLIAKALKRNFQKGAVTQFRVKRIYAFVEKLGPMDSPATPSNLTPAKQRMLESIIHAIKFLTGNTFGGKTFSRSGNSSSTFSKESEWRIETHMLPAITSEMANEFAVQLRK